ncbi:MAG: tail fiber protein [Negativicutes bacterium]|nr:tail fiber protein [Negativicutes bacterium]
MEKINEKIEWSDVELLEDGMILTGGEDGTANEQAKALANRTGWLKENKAGEVNGQTVQEGKVSIQGKDILVDSGRTIQAELDQKSDTNHTHEGGGLAPEITLEDAGKVLAINKEGTGTEWQVVSGNPTGTIIAWAGLTPPAGYLECAGQILKRDIYKDLFKAIGTVWGTTGEDNFQLPDFTSAARFLRSRGDGLEVGEVQGDAIRNIKGDISIAHYIGAVNGVFTIPTGIAQNIGSGSGAWKQSIGSANGGLATKDFFDASRVVPTADENRPKNAVVMYCIKAVDEYINPAQVDVAKVDQEKANRDEVKELAGTRLWVSGEYQPVINTPTIVEHGLNIDPLRCKCDVVLKCVSPTMGYEVGDFLIGFSLGIEPNNGDYCTVPPTPNLTKSMIQLNTGNGFFSGIKGVMKSNGNHYHVTNAELLNWRYIFRIWY